MPGGDRIRLLRRIAVRREVTQILAQQWRKPALLPGGVKPLDSARFQSAFHRFAVVAVSVGTFSLGHAVTTFAVIAVGEIVWGLGVGWGMLRLRRWVRDTRIEVLLSVLTPFLAYWPPEQLGGSGVLATVTAGLYISWNGLRLISAATRLQGVFFWDLVIYVIEGMVFLITGLQARALIARLD